MRWRRAIGSHDTEIFFKLERVLRNTMPQHMLAPKDNLEQDAKVGKGAYFSQILIEICQKLIRSSTP